MPQRDLIARAHAASIDRQEADERYREAMREAIAGGVAPGLIADLTLGRGGMVVASLEIDISFEHRRARANVRVARQRLDVARDRLADAGRELKACLREANAAGLAVRELEEPAKLGKSYIGEVVRGARRFTR